MTANRSDAREIHVAVGVIREPDGRILITRRAAGSHQGDLWEFPGGKLEPGESITQGLRRELREELGIHVEREEPLCRIRHDYGDRRVYLDVRRVTRFSGTPRPQEGQPLRRLRIEELRHEEFPEANRAIIRCLKLPDLMGITPAMGGDERRFLARVERAMARHPAAGVRLRLPDSDAGCYRRIAAQCLELARRHDCRLLLNTDPALARELDGAGLHAGSRELMALRRRPVEEDRLFGASCHSPEELEHARVVGADYAFLSPVLATPSHLDAQPLGWRRFAELAAQADLPVYALGGMQPEHLPLAREHGARGIAGIRLFMPD